MVDAEYSFTLRVVGTGGEALVGDFIKPHEDDRLTITTPEGTTVERFGTRTSYTYQLEAFAAHVRDGTELPLDTADAVANMALIDDAYRAAGMNPWIAARAPVVIVKNPTMATVPPTMARAPVPKPIWAISRNTSDR